MTYEELLKNKRRYIHPLGFEAGNMPDTLYPFQQFATTRALKHGRFALFEECGLGKTRQFLIFADRIVKKENKPVLILCPLAVSGQTIKEGENIGIEVKKFNAPGKADIRIANYEQLENINVDEFCGIVLDESSILKNFDGVYRNKLISSFRRHHYRLCCTATPSPNDIMELGNHTEFLGIMPRNEMLAMYFVHDGGETNKWRLKGHAQDVFWQFVSSWALVVSKPSSIGFDDTGYTLPPLKYHTHEIKTALKGSKLFNDTAVSAIDFNAELRRTMAQRMDLAAEIAAGVTGQNVIWVKQNEEGQQLLKRIPGAIEVQGSDSIEYKEEMLLAFAAGQIKNLITKTKICGYGMNWQNCSNTTFAAPDFSFEQTYQGIRRFYRFGNPNEVNANFIITDTMQNILSEFKRKQAQHEEMQNRTEKFVHNYQQADEFKQTQNLKQFKLPSWI